MASLTDSFQKYTSVRCVVGLKSYPATGDEYLVVMAYPREELCHIQLGSASAEGSVSLAPLLDCFHTCVNVSWPDDQVGSC